MKLFKKAFFIIARRRIRKLPPLLQGQAKFDLKYHGKYSYGFGSYGLPIIYDWNEGTTLKIGSYCSIAADVQIFLGGNHRADWISTFPFRVMTEEARHIPDDQGSKGDVTIGSDVWLCSSSIILSGVTIGHGAIVAAGAVVSKDVAPYSIVAGNPARHVKWRFDAKTRDELLAMEWWTWPEHEIKQASAILSSNNIEKLILYANNRQHR